MLSSKREGKPLYLVCGIECSGKSSFATYLQKKEGYGLVRMDEAAADIHDFLEGRRPPLRTADTELPIQFFETRSPAERKFHLQRWTMVESMYRIYDALERWDGVIVDGTFVNRDSRKVLLAAGEKLPEKPVPSAYWMNTSLDECVRRYRNRNDHISGKPGEKPKPLILREEKIVENHKSASPPTRAEGFEDVFFVTCISPTEFDVVRIR